ncbi:zinc finger MYM-type protein 1-like [Mercenaria mercenaria]|uniref:zinc finger MYM-type protein 1-like n=1 Tax=Mercenaria mercenaria TaxID=6596 RepID=UPI00234F14DE|nr:zinc finger MYM-type protein 1-like [Mercenaria mercenaria]
MVEKNRKILTCIVETIILCGKQNIALRGHTEESSNFKALLSFKAKDNSVLRQHLEEGDPRSKYLSPLIQNELVTICGEVISSEIVEACNKAGAFSLIADEASDASTMEQMSLCLRFVQDGTNMIREDFVGFAETESTTGESLANAFLENLRNMGVIVENMKGQGYDGASNMSGKTKGVQARVKTIIPESVYTHYKAHCLNLAIVHASKEAYPRNMMNIVQTIAFAFDYSAKRLLSFQSNLENDQVSREQMEKRKKLQTLCETRWAARADALYTFLSSFR